MLAAFGAQVIRIEDPVTEGRWDALRAVGPFVDERRGVDMGGGFNNHNVGKLGVTLNLRTDAGRSLLRELVATCDVVTENFAAGKLAALGFGYDELRAIRDDIVYVANSGFGAVGPYRDFKTWGPIVQAVSGLTFTSGLPDREPAGWGFSYMDHAAAYFMAIAILAALHHRAMTGEGQFVDLASTAGGLALLPTELLDWTVNGRPSRREGSPGGNRADHGEMSPHGIYRAVGDDRWVAVACRDDADWVALAELIDEPWADDPDLVRLTGRLAAVDVIDERLSTWARGQDADALADRLVRAGIPASVVKSPEERIDGDPELLASGLFPEVIHPLLGAVRVEGLAFHLSATDWSITEPAPCLGEHNHLVFGQLLGHSDAELAHWRDEGVL
jgi:crotonobetainyl-CoA:carnitine CoA-transferase CaiB-like acyl-CoA transferase